MVDRFRPGWRGTQLGEVQIMEVIFAAAAAAVARGDMYAAVVGMWSSGQAGLALQRGEARGGRDGGKEDVAKRAAAAAPPAHLPAPRPTLAAERQKPG